MPEQSVTDRLKAVIGGDGQSQCRHEQDDIWPDEDESIWHLDDTLKERRYWSEKDAAFVELRERVKELRCFGCGEQKTIETGEMTGEVRWKADMDPEELAEMREEVNSGSFYNGILWWEDNIWERDASEAANRFDHARDVGYADWGGDEKCAVDTANDHSGGEQ